LINAALEGQNYRSDAVIQKPDVTKPAHAPRGRRVRSLRRLALSHRRLFALLFAVALLAKLLVPAGYMPTVTGKTFTVAMCNGTEPVTITVPMTGKGDTKHSQQGADQPCAFAALGGQSLAAADPVLLATALVFAFILALFAIPLPPLRRDYHLRPPLRGPPALA
jgi:hypothetical protein